MSPVCLRDFGINIPAQFISSPGTVMVEVPNAIANQLHMRHGWTALATVKEVLDKNQIDYSTFNQVSALINVPAMIIVALVTTLLVFGIKESARVNDVIVLIKVAIVVTFILVGLPMVTSANWGGKFIPESTEWFHYGWSGVFRGAGLVFFAYIGFDAVSTAAQEAKNPQRDMPIGIIGSLVICTILYCLGAIVLTGVVNYKQLDVPDPVAVAIDAMGMIVAFRVCEAGRDRGFELGDPGHALESAANFLLDGPRRFAAQGRRKHTPPVSHAVDHDDHHRRDRDDRGRDHTHRHRG